MATPIKHVVIIVKENHTFDNYFGTLANADGATVAHAQNPPPDDPDHKHQTWMNRATDTVHKVQYTKRVTFPVISRSLASLRSATSTFLKSRGRPHPIT